MVLDDSEVCIGRACVGLDPGKEVLHLENGMVFQYGQLTSAFLARRTIGDLWRCDILLEYVEISFFQSHDDAVGADDV